MLYIIQELSSSTSDTMFVQDTSGYKTHQLHGTSSIHFIFISYTSQLRDYQITSQRSGT